MTVFDTTPKRRNGDRSVTLTWEIGETTDHLGKPATAAAQLFVGHYSSRKQFTASIKRVDITTGEFRGEMHSPFSGTKVQLPAQAVARYSAKALEDAVAASLEAARALAHTPEVRAVLDPTSPA